MSKDKFRGTLIFSRREDESIIIGDDIEITVYKIRGDKVHLAIKAPRSISVHRKEIYEAIHREKAARKHPLPVQGFIRR